MAGSVFRVGQVNAYIKNMFAQDYALHRISVKGEVSNCKYHSSGHIYFTLKDETGVLKAVMFAGQRSGLRFRMQEGMQVIASGSIMVYERDGTYQLYAREIVPDGVGDLYRRFEENKRRLEEMGMFAPEYKQPIPRFASRVGIVTASTGAAIRDICNISARRNPYVQLILYPAIVQGAQAAPSIVRGIETLDAMNLDVIIVGRGGGSMEDLWAFNEEEVARAIFDCQTPVISAVGHETDTTIADYVADLRAPTPSAAAELAVFDIYAFHEELYQREARLKGRMSGKLHAVRYRLEQQARRLEPLPPRIPAGAAPSGAGGCRAEASGKRCAAGYRKERHQLALAAARLEVLSPPCRSFQGGYGYISDEDGRTIRSVRQTAVGAADPRAAGGRIAVGGGYGDPAGSIQEGSNLWR